MCVFGVRSEKFCVFGVFQFCVFLALGTRSELTLLVALGTAQIGILYLFFVWVWGYIERFCFVYCVLTFVLLLRRVIVRCV